MIDFHIHSYFSDGDQTPQSILEVAQRRRLSAIAITDHCDITGRFMYLRDISEPRPLREYIDEIHALPTIEDLSIFIGVEICDFSNPALVPPEFSELDFLLIETFPAQTPQFKTFNPIDESIKLKHRYNFPVGLAHPTIYDIEQNIDQIDQYNLFIELNVDKLLSPPSSQVQILQRTADILHSSSKLQISIGSDAHIIFLIGAVKILWDFVLENDFQDRLILI